MNLVCGLGGSGKSLLISEMVLTTKQHPIIYTNVSDISAHPLGESVLNSYVFQYALKLSLYHPHSNLWCCHILFATSLAINSF